MAKAKAAAAASSGGKGKAKKKWSKGKVKDKAVHAVTPDKALIERVETDVPAYRFISD